MFCHSLIYIRESYYSSLFIIFYNNAISSLNFKHVNKLEDITLTVILWFQPFVYVINYKIYGFAHIFRSISSWVLFHWSEKGIQIFWKLTLVHLIIDV